MSLATIENHYQTGLRTTAKHLKSGNEIITDAPIDNNGRGEAFSPTDMVCAALSSCMMTIMGIMAEREGIALEGLASSVTKIMAANPRRIQEIHVDFHAPQLQATDAQKEKLKRAALTCPVGLSLSPEIVQKVTFDF